MLWSQIHCTFLLREDFHMCLHDLLNLASRNAATPRGPKTIKNRRGDIHSSVSITPSSTRRVRRAGTSDPTSDGGLLDIPASNALTAAEQPSEEPDEIRAIWGTTVNLADTMQLFKEFLKSFKPKYRTAYDRELGVQTRVFSSPDEAEVPLYEEYMRRMRTTGVTNLNLDVVNLLAYPPARRLHAQLQKYPQEVIPAMDQSLKDMMLETAERDQQSGMEDMLGQHGEAEIADIMGKVYKVRPFGLSDINMRELNPTGRC